LQNGSPIDLTSQAPPKGIRIRGAATGTGDQEGPFIIVAENFAPGTTAQDIESAMRPFGGEDLMVTSLLHGLAGVTAEIEVLDFQDARLLLKTFHGQVVSILSSLLSNGSTNHGGTIKLTNSADTFLILSRPMVASSMYT
jgi:hypothetical protein